MSKVTAERDALDDFAPEFAEMNDDVLFGGLGHGSSSRLP